MIITGRIRFIDKCRKSISAFSSLCLAFFSISCATIGPAMSQSFPNDFSVELVSGVLQPGYPIGPERVTINASGSVNYSEMERADRMLAAENSEISREAVAAIYASITENDFFGLKERYESPAILDGDYAELTITANGNTHSVRTVNIKVKDFDDIVTIINRQLPEDRWIIYNALHIDEYDEVER